MAGPAPASYLIPSTVWLDPVPPFVSRDFENLKSAPEYGLNLSNAAHDAPRP